MRYPVLLCVYLWLVGVNSEEFTSKFTIRKPREANQDGITNGCLLPQQPIRGSFELDDCTGSSCDVSPGRIVPKNSLITYKCNDGYTLIGNAVSYCYINTWQPLPTCAKTCPALRSDSVDFECRYNGKIVACDSVVLPGTTATLTCKAWYNIPFASDPGYRELICLGEGVWDRTVFHCNPECGTVSPRGSPTVVNGMSTRLGEFPWHVGVYERSGNFEQICGGSLISPSIVVSAAHCFYNDAVRMPVSASKFAVASGKYFCLYNFPEPYAQKSTIKKIDIPNEFTGVTTNYANDIAVLHLDTPFTMTPFVRPICMDWDNKYERQQLQNGNSGKVMGWGTNENGDPSPELWAINLPYVDFQSCFTTVPEEFKSFITIDKFCAGYLNGSSACNGDSGGGLSFELDGRWILRGIVSTGPTGEFMCNPNYYTTFTKVGHHLRFLHDSAFKLKNISGREDLTISVITSVTSIADRNTVMEANGCILPEQPTGGIFELGSCTGQCDIVPGNRVPIGSFLTYRCNEDYVLRGNSVTICHNNDWYMPPTCSATRKYCPALRSERVNFDCKYHDEIVSCQNAIASGTKAILACKEFYKISSDDVPGYKEITCLEDGTWNHPVFECVPECGIAIPNGNAGIFREGLPFHHRFPWLVEIHDKITHAIVPGTLISLNLVIADAYWFYETRNVRNSSDFEISTLRPLLYIDSPHDQRSPLKRIDVSANYVGASGDNAYHYHIALIHLEKTFIMTTFVRPVCINWDDEVQRRELENGNLDKLEGWDSRRNSTCLVYISREKCISRPNMEKRKRYLTPDTFCATYCSNETSRCERELGYNAVGYESDGRWYMLGLRKLVLDCNETDITPYTYLRPHRNWILTAYDNEG